MIAQIKSDAEPKPPPAQAYCRVCGGWIATAPAGTTWIRGRCINRRCANYGEAQQIKTTS